MAHYSRGSRRPANRPPLDRPTLQLILAEDAGAGHGNSLAEIIEGELVVENQQPSFSDVSIDALLDAFIDERGRLVPARLAERLPLLPAAGRNREKALSRARQLDDLRANAWADGTLVTYGSAVRAWRDWCRREDVPALPFDPKRVADHLVELAFRWQGDQLLRDALGQPLPAVTAGTVNNRLSGLNKAAEFVGLPRPGDNIGVRELMRGIRRTLGNDHSLRKSALDLKGVVRCLEAATGAGFASARNRALVLLRARTGATAGQLARLHWADVSLGADGVDLELAPTSRYGSTRTVTIRRHRNPLVCLVQALQSLRRISPQLEYVLTSPTGGPLTRQAVHLVVDGAKSGGGAWKELPRRSDRELAALLETTCPVTPLAEARDRALLLTGFYTARRRSELSALNWRDLTDHAGDGWEMRVRRSKTDQEGRGVTKWLPQADPGSDAPCPATALREYHRALSASLGRRPDPAEAVFVALTSGGSLTLAHDGGVTRITGSGINDIVQRLTVAAGLAASVAERNPYGGHSLRAGFVTEALRDDKLTIAEVQEVTDHKSVDVLMTYRREVNAANHNASRKLLGALSKKS